MATAAFQVRMPPGMRQQVKLAARRNRRSMNAEIVFHLERAMGSQGAAAGPCPEKAIPAAHSQPAAETAVSSTPSAKDAGHDK